ncbi:MAG TPA: hypothetical protein VGJ59_24060 [Jatrophihabitantaceae bacterium]
MATADPLEGLDSYERRHLVSHLAQLRRRDDLRRLLSWDRPDGRNAWYEAKRAADALDAYAQELATALAAIQRYPGDLGAAVADEYRYALMLASLNSLSAQVPPALLGAMVSRGLISHLEAQSHARRTRDVRQRAQGLLSLLPLCTGADRGRLRAEVAETARELHGSRDRTPDQAADALQTLAAIVPEAGPDERAAYLDLLLDWLAARMAYDRRLAESKMVISSYRFSDAVASVAEFLSQRQAARLLEIVSGAPDELVRTALLPKIAARVETSLLVQVVEEARQLRSTLSRAATLDAIAAYLSPTTREQVQAETVVPQGEPEARALADRAVASTGAERDRLAAAARLAARAATDPVERAIVLAKLAALAHDPAERQRLAEEAIAAAERLPEAIVFSFQLAQLAQLSTGLPELARDRFQAPVLLAARARHGFEKVQALAQVSEHLQPVQRAGLVAEALAEFQAMGDTSVGREYALQELAPRLSADQLRVALETVWAIEDEQERREAQAALMPYRLSAPVESDVAAFLAAAPEITWETCRIDAFLGLADRVDGPRRTTLLEAALEAARNDYHSTSYGLIAMAPMLAGEPTELWQRAFDIARKITDVSDRFDAMLALCGPARARVRKRAVADTLAVARSITDGSHALAEVAQLLPVRQRQAVLAEAADVATALVDRTDEALRQWQSPYLHLPVQALAITAAHVSEPARSALTARVLQECDRLPDRKREEEVRALATVARYSRPDDRQRLLATALRLALQEPNADALIWLAPELDEAGRETVLVEAVERVARQDSWVEWHDVALALRTRPPEEIYRVLQHSPDGLRHRPREHIAKELTALAPVLFKALPSAAAAGVHSALDDVGRWWT